MRQRPTQMETFPGALLTDLYQLTMAQGYFAHGLTGPAVFEFFVRRLPSNRSFLVAAGLPLVIEMLEQFRFDQGDLDFLKQTGRFSDECLHAFSRMRFTGDVHALPEGTVFFAQEPVLRITAPLPEAQVVETRVINLLHYSTLVASKAARCRLAAPGRTLVDFGLRRAHGGEAGMLAARAAWLAGFDAVANVRAGQVYGIPISGTMAHSFVQAHANEAEAFRSFARANPGNVVLLLDTYDVDTAVERVISLAAELREEGIAIRGVRLDSGDLAAQARRVRTRLDKAGLTEVKIFASGNLDEYRLAELVKAPIDGFGVGTCLTTSADCPYLDCVYKLQEYNGRPCRKRSEGKATWPGRKQIWRRFDAHGQMAGDVVGLEDESIEGQALLQPVLRAGRLIKPLPTLEQARAHAAEQLDRLPAPLRQWQQAPRYSVELSEGVRALAARLDRERL